MLLCTAGYYPHSCEIARTARDKIKRMIHTKPGQLKAFAEAISTMFVKSLARLMAAAIQPETNLHDPDYLAKLWVWLLSDFPDAGRVSIVVFCAVSVARCQTHGSETPVSDAQCAPATPDLFATSLCPSRGLGPGDWRYAAATWLGLVGDLRIECLPVPHVPLGYLVQRLSLSSLLLLFRLALLERKVVLRSSSAFTLAACGEAITSLLLFPFRWQHSYMPVSPVKREYLQQKGPYVLGLHREVLDLGNAALTALPSSTSGGSCAFSVFDLDVGEVEIESAAV
ncbi:DENND5A, partial [Symbiodinium microadriaticum]